MARLPQTGGDAGVWGDILNDFLSQSHNGDGTLKPGVVSGATIQDGSVGATKLASSLNATIDSKLDFSQKGAVNGVASLDASGKVPSSQLPTASGGSISENSGVLTDGTHNWYNKDQNDTLLNAKMTDPLTTKGDIVVRGATTTRLPVGNDNQVLMADSSTASGVKWANVQGGGAVNITESNGVLTDSTYSWYSKAQDDTLLAAKADLADAAPLSVAAPLGNGIATAGTSGAVAREDHVHPMQPIMPGYPIGPTTYSYPIGHPLSGTGTAGRPGNAKCPGTPLPVYRTFRLESLYLSLGSGYGGTTADAGTCAIAIYQTGTSGLPTGAPLYTSSFQAANVDGMKEFSGINIVLQPGVYTIFFGAMGFVTTRPVPLGFAIPNQYAISLVTPGRDASPNKIPSYFLSGYDEATGTFPTLSGSQSEHEPSNEYSIWWYSLRGTLI